MGTQTQLATLLKRCSDARRRLERLGKAESLLGMVCAIALLGGHQAAANLITLATITDSGGMLGAKEIQTFKEQGEAFVRAALNSYMNAGVVAALVLSTLVPIALEYVMHEVADDLNQISLTRLKETPLDGWTFNEVTAIGMFASMQMALSAAFVGLLLSARFYSQVSFWMPSLEAKVLLVTQMGMLPFIMELTKNAMVVMSAAFLVFAISRSFGNFDLWSCVALLPLISVAATWTINELLTSLSSCRLLRDEAAALLEMSHALSPGPCRSPAASACASAGSQARRAWASTPPSSPRLPGAAKKGSQARRMF